MGKTNSSPSPPLCPQVSELRQQLRKRGLPVSGTKPALLQRLRPFQLPHSCLAPAPLCQLGTSLEPLVPPSQSPGSGSSSGLESPGSSPNQQMYILTGGIPGQVLGEVPNAAPNGALSAVPAGFASTASVSLTGEQCGLANAVFLAPAGTASGIPSPSLPMSSSSPLQSGTPWTTTETEQRQQQELSVELEMRERLRNRPADRSASTGTEVNKDDLRCFKAQSILLPAH